MVTLSFSLEVLVVLEPVLLSIITFETDAFLVLARFEDLQPTKQIDKKRMIIILNISKLILNGFVN
jgi:hypothetical protein